MHRMELAVFCGCCMVAAPALAGGGWVTYTNETSVRLSAASTVGSGDTEEKDYDFGDVDHDLDIDMVVVRKQIFTTAGGRRNVLLMNVNGVLTDQTTFFIPDFMDATNDRDVKLIDVDNDGWDDLVTAAACNSGNCGMASESRLYMNLGAPGGTWLGFDSPVVLFTGHNFCSVAEGDVTDDGYADLYFVAYNDSQQDQMLINQGAGNPGVFSNGNNRLTTAMRSSGFGTAGIFADMNNDGTFDIVKSENGPAEIFNNDPNNVGFFNILDSVYSGAAYHVGVGDLNNDDRLDLVLSDDGTDRYMLNTGNGGNGMADFNTFSFPSSTGGFGSDSYVVDLDEDGWNDVVICDVDVDAGGCVRVSDILQNNGNAPNVSFTSNQANISSGDLTAVHDMAIFDVNGDDYLDLVIGRCSGTAVWINSPPISLDVSYPNGLPELVTPGQTTAVSVNMAGNGDTILADTETLHVSVNGGSFVTVPMTDNGGGNYTATLPASNCSDQLDYYVSAQLATSGLTFTDPSSAPAATYGSVAADGTVQLFEDEIEGDVVATGWTVVSDPSLVSGEWEQAVPIGTFFNGQPAAPNSDATPNPGTQAFVTENSGFINEPYGANDVDGGPTHLISPTFDLTDSDAFVSYKQWMFHDQIGQHDELVVSVSNDNGANWTQVYTVTTTGGTWQSASFTVGDYVTPTAEVKVRFTISDEPNDSVAEAGIDDFNLDQLECLSTCVYDTDGSGDVGVTDLLDLLAQWGTDPGGPPDFDANGDVGVTDLLALLGAWGDC